MGPPESYLTTSFVGDLSYQPPASQAAGLAHTFVTGRKTWKTLKSKKNEAVWPVHIEAALFEALEIYRPASSGDPRLLRRFPKRNRFISDHIFKVTGKMRTPKQVGSRLQQLRDTCQEERVLKLLSRREYPPLLGNRSHRCDSSPSPGALTRSLPSSASSSPVSTPTDSEFKPLQGRDLPVSPAHSSPTPSIGSVIYIEIALSSHPTLEIALNPSLIEPVNLVTFDLPAYHAPGLMEDRRYVRLDKGALVNGIVPLMSFSCAERGLYRSMYCVFFEDNLVHSEVTAFTPHAMPPRSGATVYRTRLVPHYWEVLAVLGDLSRYTIAQDIIKVTATEDTLVFSTAYKFNFPSPPVHLEVPVMEDCKPPIALLDQYFSNVDLRVPGSSPRATPHLGPTPPLCAIRPAYTDMGHGHGSGGGGMEQLQGGNDVWFDQACQYGIVMPQPVLAHPQLMTSASDGVEFINLSVECPRMEPSVGGDGHYYGPPYWS